MTKKPKKEYSDQVTVETQAADNTRIIKAVSHVYGFLPQIAGSIVGFSALAYFIGWRMLSAYYDSLGAPWAKSLLSSTQIIQASVNTSFFIIISFYVAFSHLLDKGEDSATSLNRISIYFSVAAPLFLMGGLFLKTWISLKAIYVFYLIAVMLYGCFAGICIAELIGLLAREQLKWRSYHIELIYLITFTGFYFAPGQYGNIRAQLHRSPETSTLERIQIVQPALNEDWHLVTVFGDKTLVMRIAEKRKDRTFKIISTTAIQTVKPHVEK